MNYWASGEEIQADYLFEERTFARGLIAEYCHFWEGKEVPEADISEKVDDGDNLSEVIGQQASLHVI